MILQANGKPIPYKTIETAAQAVVFISTDGNHWAPVAPDDVPDSLKHPDNMGLMMAGEILELANGCLYKAEKVSDVPVQ
ncbi:hypothetical protein [Marinobacterium litorale]|uniref:hypothetical protein n=1 Tax=Marinobacterium litorale TaxID=404770 RepID=UPI0004239339|nr:hypothetical protein [Marinobacterium litorale]